MPCRNEAKHIERCVAAILANDYPNKEVIVVDGMSNDGTRERLQSIQGIKVVDNEAQVTPVAFNLGIENSSGSYICIVGSRMMLDTNYLTTCFNILNEQSTIACVGGVIINEYENDESELIAVAMASPFGMGIGNFRTLKEDAEVDTVSAPMYRKAIFDELGIFDERLVRNQDDEFNFRVTKAGYQIFQTAKTSYKYYVRASRNKLFTQFFQYGYWKVFVNKKHKTVTTIRQLVPLFFVLYLVFFWLPILVSPVLTLFYVSGLFLYVLLASWLGGAAAADHSVSAPAERVMTMISIYFLLHFGYGWGYLRGIIDFFILGKQPAEKNKQLSR